MKTRIPYKWLVATAFVLGLFMEILDMTVLNTALPILGEHFNADTAQLQWLVTGYLISLAVFIPASGWVADRFGDKQTFVFALAIYTAANLWAGMSDSVTELLLARITQGIGGGLLTPVGTAMLFRAFPPGERAKASAALAVPTTLAPMLGPVIGGWLAEEVSWRWIFFMKVPFGIFALLFSILMLRRGETQPQQRFDIAGFLTGGAGLATLLVGLETGSREGWGEPLALPLVIVGAVLAVLFVVVETRISAPMIDLRLLKDRMFAIGNVLMLPASGAAMGAMFVLPLMLQMQMGLSATQSGLITAAQAIGMLAMLPFTNRIFQAFGPRKVLVAGFGLITLSQVVLMGVGTGTGLWVIATSMFVLGLAGAMVMVPLQAATFAGISFADTTRASAVFSTSRQVAASVGVALLATVLTVRTADHSAGATDQVAAAFSAYQDVFLVSAAIGVLGIALSLLIRDADASASRESSPEPLTKTVEAV